MEQTGVAARLMIDIEPRTLENSNDFSRLQHREFRHLMSGQLDSDPLPCRIDVRRDVLLVLAHALQDASDRVMSHRASLFQRCTESADLRKSGDEHIVA